MKTCVIVILFASMTKPVQGAAAYFILSFAGKLLQSKDYGENCKGANKYKWSVSISYLFCLVI